MRAQDRFQGFFWAALLAMPMAAVIVLRARPGLDRVWMDNAVHFYVVSGTALLAAAVCAVLIASARSLRQTRLLFLALAFLSIAALFATHGLTTPGFIHDEPYPALDVSAWLSVFVGAAFITASALELPDRAADWVRRCGGALFVLTVAGLAVYLYAGLFVQESEWLSWVPIESRPFQLSIAALVLAMLTYSIRRYLQAYVYLCKPGPLTSEEYAIVKQHALRGGEIAGRVKALRPLREAIRHHHERFDGGGYPDGLRGEAIPLLARIIAVADTYDALTSSRPYRPAGDHEAAFAELRRVSGTQLDPACVEAFLAGLRRAQANEPLQQRVA